MHSLLYWYCVMFWRLFEKQTMNFIFSFLTTHSLPLLLLYIKYSSHALYLKSVINCVFTATYEEQQIKRSKCLIYSGLSKWPELRRCHFYLDSYTWATTGIRICADEGERELPRCLQHSSSHASPRCCGDISATLTSEHRLTFPFVTFPCCLNHKGNILCFLCLDL